MVFLSGYCHVWSVSHAAANQLKPAKISVVSDATEVVSPTKLNQTQPYGKDTKIADVINNPFFGTYGRLIFPVNQGYCSGDTLGELRLTWYNNINAEKAVEVAIVMAKKAKKTRAQKEESRIALARNWLPAYEGMRIVRAYCGKFHVDTVRAVRELQEAGYEFKPGYVDILLKTEAARVEHLKA
jgi:hypothetical protein